MIKRQRDIVKKRAKIKVRQPIVLAIETSCDETSVAVACGPDQILSNVVASSLDEHAKYGGVIPEIASRAHLEAIVPVLNKALRQARIKPNQLDAIAVTQGPGLVGSLLVGISFARALALGWKKPVIGVNHVLAHLYAPFINVPLDFPFAGMVVSGGHTNLYRVRSFGREELFGYTRDDAAGEAFDKVAKILGLGYPGGPMVEKMAATGRPSVFPFRCDCGHGFEFSFSGIKTAVLYKVRDLTKHGASLSAQTVSDICASFQEAVVSDLVSKSVRAAVSLKSGILCVGGGVAFNNFFRRRLQMAADEAGIVLRMASKDYCLDNAAMVASLGARMFVSTLPRARMRISPVFPTSRQRRHCGSSVRRRTGLSFVKSSNRFPLNSLTG